VDNIIPLWRYVVFRVLTDKARKFIEKIQLIHHKMQEQLEKSERSYKARHDKHWVDHKFQVGDEVWLYIRK